MSAKHLLTTAALVLALGAPALAQQSTAPAQPAQERPAASRDQATGAAPAERAPGAATGTVAAAPAAGGDLFIVAQDQGQVLAESVIGAEVRGRDDDDSIGSISDLVFDGDGRLIGAVVGAGGFLGMGEKNVAVDWNQIEWTTDEDGDVVLTAGLMREDLEQAPAFKDLAEQRREQEAALAAEQQRQQMQRSPVGTTTGTTGTSQ